MIGYWLDAVEAGCRFGRDSRVAKPWQNWLLPVVALMNNPYRDPTWVHGYRIGCYIRDAWLRLR